MNTYSIYKLDSGLFTGDTYTCSSEHLVINVADGCGCILGEFDSLSQKIDLDTGLVVDYTPPEIVESDEELANRAKNKREQLLAETDWLSIRSCDGIPIPNAWKQYRQELRDITKQEGYPLNTVWPDKPEL